MSFELLWTDQCFLVLLTLGFIITLFSLRKQPIRHSFSIILRRPLAVSAGIVLLAFVIIGVLDSIHFKDLNFESDNANSLLDKIVAPIGDTYEKTYSAPLALRMYVTETELVNGVAKQIYPRLKYPPQTIQNEADKHHIIKNVLWLSLGYSILVSFGFWCVVILIKAALKSKSVFSLNPTGVSSLLTLGGTYFFYLGRLLVIANLSCVWNRANRTRYFLFQH